MSFNFPEGFSFVNTGGLTLTNFSSADNVVYISDGVPTGFKGIVKDLGIIFTTSGGSVYIARRSLSGSDLRITDNISSTATGLGGIVLDEGEKIVIKIGSAGSGVITIYSDGEVKEKPTATQLFRPILNTGLEGRGGF